jgi:ATP-dependent DNA ligase
MICCSVASGRTLAFDALAIAGEDLRPLPLIERKRRLARIMPRVESRLMFLDPIERRGRRLFELACERDLEGVVAKFAHGSYRCDGRSTSWLKIKNPQYSQMEGRYELFERKRIPWDAPRSGTKPPALALV